jgi:hypothetical protein
MPAKRAQQTSGEGAEASGGPLGVEADSHWSDKVFHETGGPAQWAKAKNSFSVWG